MKTKQEELMNTTIDDLQIEIDAPKTFMGKTIEEHQADIDECKMIYSKWRKKRHEEKTGFFPVFTQEFKPYLRDLSGNAVRLYLYLGLHSNNETGLTASADLRTMQYFFGCEARTLQRWLLELEEAQLIKRVQPYYEARRQILLRPYSTKAHLNWTSAKTKKPKKRKELK